MSNQNELQEAMGKIIEMATNDKDLKNDLVNKTKETLSVFGIDVDDDVKFVFTNGEKVEADDSTIVIDLGGAEEEEMDLEESSLENVTGGGAGMFSHAQNIMALGKIRSMHDSAGGGSWDASSERPEQDEDTGWGPDNLTATRIAAVGASGWKASGGFSVRGKVSVGL